MFPRFLFLVCFFSFFTLLVNAQNVEFVASNFKNDKEGFQKAKNQLIRGTEKFDQETSTGYKQALELFLPANQFNPNNASLNYKIGLCYLRASVKSKALPYLTKAFELNDKITPDIHYLLAQANQYSLNFEKAIEEYNIYKNSLSEESLKQLAPILGKKIEECQAGIEIIKTPLKVLIENMGPAINSPYPDYCPLISADESMLIFTSRRINSTGEEMDENEQYFEDIYVSLNVNGQWQDATNIGPPLNTDDHDATVGLSPDGQQLFTYNGKTNNGDIFVSKLDGDKWSNPKPLPRTINTDFHETSASFSYDGNTIYFVSEKLSDNYGGRDIFYSQKDKKGDWGDAKNIGPAINTPYDEDDVFMHPDGRTLYFSSKGHNSMGGFDVFKSVRDDNGQWSKPENIGYPINTPDDDRYFTNAASGKHSFYSSVREDGLGDNDIFRITYLEEPEKRTDINIALLTILKGKITDATTQLPLEATIEIVDNEKNEIIASFTSNSKTGKYLVSLPSGRNYGIVVRASDHLFSSENFNLPDSMAFQEVVKDISLNMLSQGSKVVLNNIFFDYAKATLKSESFPELDRIIELLNKYPTMRIEISGHTDNQSSMETNKKLSESRAKAVVDYLIFEGIPKARLEYKGYAFTQPIASNDTEEGRKQNRRVEFKILSK